MAYEQILLIADEAAIRVLVEDLTDAVAAITKLTDRPDGFEADDVEDLVEIGRMLDAQASIFMRRLLAHDIALADYKRPLIEFLRSQQGGETERPFLGEFMKHGDNEL
jgi:hypothetical protein